MDNAPNFKRPNAGDIDTLAGTVWAEAQSESLAGQIAVAFSVIHRARIAAAYVAAHGKPHPLYGDGSLRAACIAPEQYSCWNQDSSMRAKLLAVGADDAYFQIALYVACGAANRLLTDALPGATHYFNPKLANPPSWVTGKPAADGHPAVPAAVFVASIGNHRFYEQVPA